MPVSARISNAIVTYVVYVRQMLWPAKLAVFYPHPEHRLPMWEVGLALMVVVGLTIATFVLRKRAPYLIVGWLWYLGMLVPVIGLVQVGWQGRADRYTYLPQIGLYMAVTWAVADLTVSWRFQRTVLGAVAALLVAALSWCAWLQTSYWRDSETLFTHALAVTSNNDVALNNLGIIFLDKGQLDEAISKLQAAIDLRPDNGPAHDNLAKALLRKGRLPEAMVHYRKFLEIEPGNVEARNTLGTALIQQGQRKRSDCSMAGGAGNPTGQRKCRQQSCLGVRNLSRRFNPRRDTRSRTGRESDASFWRQDPDDFSSAGRCLCREWTLF